MAMGGRGRLSSIDLLPDWAKPAVDQAWEELRENSLPQNTILARFNDRIKTLAFRADVSFPPQISASAFNRRAMRIARHGRRMAETREIAEALASKLENGGDEKLTLLAAETIKTIVFEALENAGEIKATGLSAEMMANFALALKNAEQAKKITADTRLVIDKNFKAKAKEAIAQVAESKGLSKEVREAMLREMLGVRQS